MPTDLDAKRWLLLWLWRTNYKDWVIGLWMPADLLFREVHCIRIDKYWHTRLLIPTLLVGREDEYLEDKRSFLMIAVWFGCERWLLLWLWRTNCKDWVIGLWCRLMLVD